MIGTKFSDKMEEDFSYDTTVEIALKASFWGVFEESLGVSTTTGKILNVNDIAPN